MPVEMAIQKLRDDPETKKIADAFNMELEDYIAQVMEYAQNPDLEPQLQIMADDDLRELGMEIPADGAIEQWFEDVASGKIKPDTGPDAGHGLSDGFKQRGQSQSSQKRALVGADKPTLEASHVEASKGKVVAGGALKDQILEQQQLIRQLGAKPRKARKAVTKPRARKAGPSKNRR